MTEAVSSSNDNGNGNSNGNNSSSNCATNRDVVTTKFVILGAGIAGLQCAAKLLSMYGDKSHNRQTRRSDDKDNDKDTAPPPVSDSHADDDDPTTTRVVLVLEARKRIGGRIYTTTEELEVDEGDGEAARHDNNGDGDGDDATTNRITFSRDHGASWVHGIGGGKRNRNRSRLIRKEEKEKNDDDDDDNEEEDDDDDAVGEPEVEALNAINPMVELVQRAATAEATATATATAIKNDDEVKKEREKEEDEDDVGVGIGEELPIQSRRTTSTPVPTPVRTTLIPIYEENPWTRPHTGLHNQTTTNTQQHKLVLLMDGKRIKFVNDGNNKNENDTNHHLHHPNTQNHHGESSSSSSSSAGNCQSSDSVNDNDNDNNSNNNNNDHDIEIEIDNTVVVVDYHQMMSQYLDLKRRIGQETQEMDNLSDTEMSQISIDAVLSKILVPGRCHVHHENENENGNDNGVNGNDNANNDNDNANNENENDNSRRISQQQQTDQLLFLRQQQQQQQQQRQALIVPLFYFFLCCDNWNGQSAGDLQADSMTTNTTPATVAAAAAHCTTTGTKTVEDDDIDGEGEGEGGGDGDFWGPHCKVSTGMATLLHPLVQDVGWEKIRLNQPVTKVHYLNNSISNNDSNHPPIIQVETANGLLVQAEYCICTIPLGCLQQSTIGIGSVDENDDGNENNDDDGNINVEGDGNGDGDGDVDVDAGVDVDEEQDGGEIELPSQFSRVTFVPPLSETKREAVSSISSGYYKKVFMTYDRIFWDDECYKEKPLIGLIRSSSVSSSSMTELPGASSASTSNTTPLGNYLLLNNLWAHKGIPCLEAVLAGRAGKWAMHKTDQEIQTAVLTFMAETMLLTTTTTGEGEGGTAEGRDDRVLYLQKHLVQCQITRWEEDPYTCGAYSSFQLGTLERHVVALQQPEWDQRLWLAGEHTHSEHMGSVHAALLSADRVADSIIQTTTTTT